MEYKLADFVDRAALDKLMRARIEEEDDVITGTDNELTERHLKPNMKVHGVPVVEKKQKTKVLSRLKDKFEKAKTRIQV